MATSNIIVTRSGTGFTVDVTGCNLDPDLTIKDFVILHNGVPYSLLGNYTKTTQTVLTYTGASLPSTTIEVRRKTQASVIQAVNFGVRMSSDLWNRELDRKTRWQEEADLNGVGAAFSGVIPAPQNDPYGVLWAGDTVFPPSRKVVYDKLETMAALASPNFTGNPTAPTQSPNNNSTRLATTAYVDAADALKANLSSPAFTGTPTAPTASPGTNTTQLATTAFVAALSALKADLASPTFTGDPKAPTPATADNDTSIATTAFARSLWTLSGSSLTYVPLNFRVTWGSAVVATNGSGDGVVGFGFTFSNLQTVVALDGDSLSLGRSIALTSTNYGSSASNFTARVSNNSSPVVGVVRINYVAMGLL